MTDTVVKEQGHDTNPLEGSQLLPPARAVWLAWAYLGGFTSSESSKKIADTAEAILKTLPEQAKQIGGTEGAYITSVLPILYCHLRSLDIIYKGRKLNYDENEILRKTYLEAIASTVDYGHKFADFFAALPTMTLFGLGGLVIGEALSLNPAGLWFLAILFTVLGNLIHLLLVQWSGRRQQQRYVEESYDRTLHYRNYSKRSKETLRSLYDDLCIEEQRYFEIPSVSSAKVFDHLAPTDETYWCPFMDKHMRAGVIYPRLWATCTSGMTTAIMDCPWLKYEIQDRYKTYSMLFGWYARWRLKRESKSSKPAES